MRHQDDGDPGTCVKLLEQFHDLGLRLLVQIAGWFIRQEDFGFIQQGASYYQPLLLTGRQLARVSCKLIAKSQGAQQRPRALICPLAGSAMIKNPGQRGIFQGRQGWQQTRKLKNKSYQPTRFAR
jgi:hypothetical protein